MAAAMEQPKGNGCADRQRFVPIGIAIKISMFLAVAATTSTTMTCNAFLPVSIRTVDSTSIYGVGRTMVEFYTTPMEQQEQEESNNKRFSSTSDAHYHNTAGAVSTNDENALDRNEKWYLDTMEEWYEYSQKQVACPFFRRRYGDVLDRVESIVRFALIRPYCADSSHRKQLGPLMAYRSASKAERKTRNLPVKELLGILRKDWRASEDCCSEDAGYFATTDRVNEKGYYITGMLSKKIYRDDCEFQSPDPDLPLKGIRKYVAVASHIFHTKTSASKLLSLEQLTEHEATTNECNMVLKATWKMSGTVNLPWKPKLSEFAGSTLYFLDKDHLVFRHEETWDISVWDAFFDLMNVKKKANNNSNDSKCPFALFFRTNFPTHHPRQQRSSYLSYLSTNIHRTLQ